MADDTQNEDLVVGIHFGKCVLDPSKAVVLDLDDTMAPFFVGALEHAMQWLSAEEGGTVEYTDPRTAN